MKKSWYGLMLILIISPGCVSSRDTLINTSATTSKSGHDHSRIPSAITNPIRSESTYIHSDSTAIRIGDETLTPNEFIQQLEKEIIEKSENLSPQQFRLYLEQTTTKHTTDRLSEMLLYQQAANRLTKSVEANIDRYISGEIRKIISKKYNGVKRLFMNELTSKGSTLEQERQKMRRELMISSYLEGQIKPKMIEPTRAELFAAYQATQPTEQQPQRRRMSLIDVRFLDHLPEGVTEPSREDMEQAKLSAHTSSNQALKEIQDGYHFADVARKYSNGLHAEDGGDWGWVSKGSVRERFEPAVEALFRLNPGETSNIVETQDSLFLVRCDEIESQHETNFQAIQPMLTKRYYQTVYLNLLNDHIDTLRKNAGINIAQLDQFHLVVMELALNKYTQQ